jgi:glycerol-3-phosphate acyltransferase PlsY
LSLDGLTGISLIFISYLIGGISSAFLVTRLVLGQDIRNLGDNNPGAANVFRNVSPKAGLTVGVFDILKGVLAVLLVRSVTDSITLELMAGVAVVAGHNWPIHLGFRGGRGAATSVGVLLITVPLVSIPVAAVSLIVLQFTKRATVALGVFLIAVPVLAFPVGYSYTMVSYVIAVPVLVGLTHYLNTKILGSQATLESDQAEERALPQG